MADLLYVHYNLRLRERQLRKRSSDSVSLDDILMEHLLDDWIVEPQKQGMQEDEVCSPTIFTCIEIPLYANELQSIDFIQWKACLMSSKCHIFLFFAFWL